MKLPFIKPKLYTYFLTAEEKDGKKFTGLISTDKKVCSFNFLEIKNKLAESQETTPDLITITDIKFLH
ncbi:hypothetical protein AGMMS50212_17320 [Spirochaetia bacterium]|nr:hypothetical protein AGMMS50212_17320 [Spirochaetia bacterium]